MKKLSALNKNEKVLLLQHIQDREITYTELNDETVLLEHEKELFKILMANIARDKQGLKHINFVILNDSVRSKVKEIEYAWYELQGKILYRETTEIIEEEDNSF